MPHGRAPPVRTIRHAHSAKPTPSSTSKQAQHRVVVALRAQHPREPDHRRVQRKRQQLLEALEPRPGTRQPPPPAGEPREQHVRQRHADAERDEHDEHRSPPTPASAKPERRAHERRGARRRDDDREHAGAERVDACGSCASSPATPDGASCPNSNTPDRLSASTKNRIASARDDRRRLQLEAPAQLLAGGAQRGEQQRRARRTSARRPPANATASWRSVGLRVVVRREAQHLERQHREHAGHQVEDQAADERGHDARARASGRRRPRGARREIERRRAARARASAPAATVPATRDVDRRRAGVAAEAVGGASRRRRARPNAPRERGRDRQRQHVARRRRA